MISIFYTEDKSILEDDFIKRNGKVEAASTLGLQKKGWYIKFDLPEEPKAEVIEKLEKVKGEEKELVVKKFKELEENIEAGVGLLGSL